MQMHYAYPLLLTVLGWWVNAVFNTGTTTELALEEKAALRKRIEDGIFRWDWRGVDSHYYDHLLNRLVPPEPQPQSKSTHGVLAWFKKCIS